MGAMGDNASPMSHLMRPADSFVQSRAMLGCRDPEPFSRAWPGSTGPGFQAVQGLT
jgi:hypothetical protein